MAIADFSPLRFSRRPIIRSVALVAGGTTASQVIGMAFSPLITRLYGPEIFGMSGLYISFAGFMGAMAGLTYPFAIVLPENDSDAISLCWLSVYSGILMSLLTSIVLFFFGVEIFRVVGATSILDFMSLIPLFILISTIATVMSQWLIRKKAFALTAKVAICQALIVNVIKTGFGAVQPTASVLVFTHTFSGLLAAGMMLLGLPKTQAQCHVKEKRSTSLWVTAKQYSDFPVYRAPQVLLNSLSQSLPVWLLATYFGPASVGCYAIASSVLGLPAGIIGGSVMQVFYPRVNEAFAHGEDLRALIVRATVALALVGAAPFALICFAGPVLFCVVFGAEWQSAGAYAQWLSVWIFLQYLNKPAVSAIPALGLQKGLLAYEVFSSGSKALALYVGYAFFASDISAIALFAAAGIAAYVWLICWVIWKCGKSTPLTERT